MRLEGIDILRGIAVSFVVLYHFFALFDLLNHPLFPYIHAFGIFGVSLFFIISGYLIYASIEQRVSLQGIKEGIKYYMIHRLFRIIPAYYVNLAVVILLYIWHSNVYFYVLIKQIIAHLTFSSYFICDDVGFGINGAYWTLQIEMVWYFLTPILFIYVKKDRYLIFIFILSVVYLLGLDFGWYNTWFGLSTETSNYKQMLYFLSFQLPGQMIYFIVGVFIYKYSQKIKVLSPFASAILLVTLLSIFIGISSQYYFDKTFVLNNMFILLMSGLLFISVYRTKLTYLSLLSWIGKISYSVYLWHMPVLFLLKNMDIINTYSLWTVSIIFIVVLLSISLLSYYFIEEKGFQLRDRFQIKIRNSKRQMI